MGNFFAGALPAMNMLPVPLIDLATYIETDWFQFLFINDASDMWNTIY